MIEQDRIEYFKNEISRLSNQVVDLLDERDQLKAQVEQLNNLLVCMQSRACLFLQPDGEDDKDFINFVIGVLDGPEQRLAQSTPDQCLAEIKAQAVEDAANELASMISAPPGIYSGAVIKLNLIANQLRQKTFLECGHTTDCTYHGD